MNVKKEVGRKRQVHASSMGARSFFLGHDEAMRTSRIMERMVCIQAVRWRDAAAPAARRSKRTVWELRVSSGSHDDGPCLLLDSPPGPTPGCTRVCRVTQTHI